LGAGIFGSTSFPASLASALTEQLVEEVVGNVERDDLVCLLGIFSYEVAETMMYEHSLLIAESMIRDGLLTGTIVH
jgi:hypothetical protein